MTTLLWLSFRIDMVAMTFSLPTEKVVDVLADLLER